MKETSYYLNKITWLPGTLFMAFVVSTLVLSPWLNSVVTADTGFITGFIVYATLALSALILGVYQIHTGKFLAGILNTALAATFSHLLFFIYVVQLLGG